MSRYRRFDTDTQRIDGSHTTDDTCIGSIGTEAGNDVEDFDDDSVPNDRQLLLSRNSVINSKPEITMSSKSDMWRNLVGFWFLGLCNNFAYVIMLSAAHDILADEEKGNKTEKGNGTDTTTISPIQNSTDTQYMECNPISTGAILLADILPTLLIKTTAPFYLTQIGYRIKVLLTILFALSSFLIVGLANEVWLSILGVVCASISGGIGEITFLSLTSFFDRNVISTWSSGTGGAGVFGSLAYAGLISAGVTPKTTVLIMVIIPIIMGINYFIVLVHPPCLNNRSDDTLLIKEKEVKAVHLTFKEKLHLILALFKYMIPLTCVYFAEYFINQGLHELLYFNKVNISGLNKKAQYRWYQVDYQVGVFISRSSVNIFPIKKLWILPVLQFLNMGVLLAQVFYRFIPNIWIVLAIVLFEGLLGGSAYVNTFYRISVDVQPEHREFSLGAATIGDTVGIAVAGAVAIPSHNHMCSLKIKMN